MPRFQHLFDHFERHLAPMMPVVYDLAHSPLVYVFTQDTYKVYENHHVGNPHGPEINPAARFMQNDEVWFRMAPDGPQAHVEYSPDFREKIIITDVEKPLLVLRVKEIPLLPGINC
jgi:hypothetical protein